MTFLAQNEYAALYVPAGFLPHVNPQLVELVLWLGSHIYDEARHIEVFTKRALAGGHHGYALASTELSLSTLLDEHDFTASSLLLNVLGEGTFLDLLRFIENHAPRRRHRHRRQARAPRRTPARPLRHLERQAHRRHRPRRGRAARSGRRGPCGQTHQPLRPLTRPRRSSNDHGSAIHPAGRSIRRRRGRPRADANDGTQPPPPSASLRPQRRHRTPPLRPAHAEPHVGAAARAAGVV
jgi:hypothetical protein